MTAPFSQKFARIAHHIMEGGHRIRPTVVLIHGGWQGPGFWSLVVPRLEKAGYSVFAPVLPSSGTSPALPNFDEDVKVIQHSIRSVLDSGKDVILVMHSYGAVPGCEAFKDLGTKEDMQNQHIKHSKGRVLKLVFLTAMVLPVGGSTWDAKKGLNPVPGFDCDKDNLITILDARTRFYNDLPHDDAAYWMSRLKTQSRLALASKLTFPAYKYFPCAYLLTTKDMALPLKVQERIVAAAGISETARVDAGHSPQISQPGCVERFIRKCAGEESSLL